MLTQEMLTCSSGTVVSSVVTYCARILANAAAKSGGRGSASPPNVVRVGLSDASDTFLFARFRLF